MSFTTEIQPGVDAAPPSASDGFTLNHCMLRVKDPAVSLAFYTRVFGTRLLRKRDFPEMKFSLYFLHRAQEGEVAPEDAGERTAWTFAQRGILELTDGGGTEVDYLLLAPQTQESTRAVLARIPKNPPPPAPAEAAGAEAPDEEDWAMEPGEDEEL